MSADLAQSLPEEIKPVWLPQPGPQVLACMAPVDFLFFGGSRGGGKTDCAIGKQLIGALQHGYKWNGLFIRKNYKHFAELRRRVRELIRAGLPAILKGGDTQTNTLEFTNGAKIMLTAIEQEEKLEFFQGQQFCVAEGTRIQMADGSGLEIEKLKVGDMIATLEGPKRVQGVMPPRVDQCVKLTNRFGSQIHPVKHPIFSAYGWQSYASVLETCSKETELSSREFSRLPVVKIPAILAGRVLDQASSETARSSESRTSPGLSSPHEGECRKIRETVFSTCLGRRLPSGLARRVRGCSLADVDAFGLYASSCEQSSSEDRDFQAYCRFGLDSDGELLPGYQGDGQETPPSQADAGGTPLGFGETLLDVQGNIPEYIHLNLPKYEHPYDGTLREVTEKNSCGACFMSPYGDAVVYDITVEEANHYIAYDTGVVNKNTLICIEEACQFSFINSMIEKFKGCMRSPHGVPCRMFLTGNPGGAGHNQIKARFISPAPQGGVPLRGEDGDISMFIPSSVADNRILQTNDPKYVARLKSIKDPKLRRAWLYGDWDVVAGGFFDDVWDPMEHVIGRFRVPEHWPRVMGIDWGSAYPFSVGWWAVASGELVPELGRRLPRGALVRYDEWYGCAKESPNVGIRLNSQQVAQGILEREIRRGEAHLFFDRVGDPKMWAQEDGPSIAENMAGLGCVLRKADNKRIPGWDLMRWYMSRQEIKAEAALPPGGGWPLLPMLYVVEHCRDFTRTVPIVERDEKEWDDVADDQEDHICDETRYVVTSRQAAGERNGDENNEKHKTACERDIEEIEDIVKEEDSEWYDTEPVYV